jgi:hypothetical protein
MDREHMLFFISYLRVIKRMRLDGRIELQRNGATTTYEVRDSNVVV